MEMIIYPLVICYIAMENGPVIVDLLKAVIFNSYVYVSLPEGIIHNHPSFIRITWGFHRATPLSLDGWFHGKTENHMDDLYSDYRGTPISGNLRSSWRFINGIFTELIQLGFVWNVWKPLQWLYNCCFSFGENHKPTITNQWIWDLEHPCGTVFSMVKGLSSSDDFIRSYPRWTVDVPNFHALRPNFRCNGGSLQESTENTATLW